MSAMQGTMMLKNYVKSKCGESSHKKKKQQQMLYMVPLSSHHLEILEKTVAFHNINHRQAKYHVGPHLAHDGVQVCETI